MAVLCRLRDAIVVSLLVAVSALALVLAVPTVVVAAVARRLAGCKAIAAPPPYAVDPVGPPLFWE
jgi:hypothetical protein